MPLNGYFTRIRESVVSGDFIVKAVCSNGLGSGSGPIDTSICNGISLDGYV